MNMGKVSEVMQNHEELVQKFHEKYGDIPLVDLDIPGSEMLLECLESKLQVEELTVDDWKFKRYHKPVTERQIQAVHDHIASRKFLNRRMA